MKQEIEVARGVTHPALIRILDVLDERTYVMEFFADGMPSKKPERYRGDVRAALEAFRPIVDAVATLQAKGIIHRDIEPDSIFVRDDAVKA